MNRRGRMKQRAREMMWTRSMCQMKQFISFMSDVPGAFRKMVEEALGGKKCEN
jgi:hypothetical protein